MKLTFLRCTYGIKRIHGVRNEVVQNLHGMKTSIDKKVEESVLRWYDHVVRIDEMKVVKENGRVNY